ncbi:TPA: hypothetical protein ACW0P3_004261 [Citrobacter freundii]
MTIKADYRGELAIRARQKLGFTQKQMGEFFGISLRSWQDKEQNTNRVSVAEYHLLMLMLNEHERYQLVTRLPENKTAQEAAAQAALDLGQYLASGAHAGIALPSVAVSMLKNVEDAVRAFTNAFNEDTLQSVDNILPPAENRQE